MKIIFDKKINKYTELRIPLEGADTPVAGSVRTKPVR